MQRAVEVVALAVRVVTVAVAPFPGSIDTVIVRTEYVQQAAGYFNLKLTSSSQTGIHSMLPFKITKIITSVHVYEVLIQQERS